MTANESTQKWTERNAAALALVDRLPVELQRVAKLMGNNDVWLSSMPRNNDENKAVNAFLDEHCAGCKIERRDADQWGFRAFIAHFPDGARMRWERKVKTIEVEDDQP